MVSDEPAHAGCQEKSSLRDPCDPKLPVLFAVKAMGTLSSGSFPVLIRLFCSPTASRSPAKVSLVCCTEMGINKCLSRCPLVRCSGPPSEKSFADKKLNQLVVTVLGREVGGRAGFN